MNGVFPVVPKPEPWTPGPARRPAIVVGNVKKGQAAVFADDTGRTLEPGNPIPAAHTHEQGDVVGLADALAGKAAASHSHAQADVTGLSDALAGKAAASHTHAQSEVTGLADALAGKAAAQHTHAQSDVTGLADALAGKAAAEHTHAQSDVTGLDDALAGKAAASHTHAQSDVTGLADALAGKAAASHTHAQADVTGLADALAGKAAASHTHAQSDVTGLADALAGKAAASHTHSKTEITDFPTLGNAATKNVGTEAGTVAAGDHTHSGYATTAALRYDLATPEPTANGTAVAVTLQDRAVNAVTLASTVTEATFTFPAKVNGKARDFFLRLVIEGSTAPTIYFVEGSANAVDPTNTNDLFDADDDSWAEIEPGVNLIMFTETQQPSS